MQIVFTETELAKMEDFYNETAARMNLAKVMGATLNIEYEKPEQRLCHVLFLVKELLLHEYRDGYQDGVEARKRVIQHEVTKKKVGPLHTPRGPNTDPSLGAL